MGANTSRIDNGLALYPEEPEPASSPRVGQQGSSPSTLLTNTPSQASPILARYRSLQQVATSSVQGSPRASSAARGQGSTLAALPSSRQESMVAASLPSHQASPPATCVVRESSASQRSTHTRPLPPVESRETVKSQAARIIRWARIDLSDEIYESCQIGDSPQSESDVGSLARYDSDTSSSDVDTWPALEGAHITPGITNSSPSTDLSVSNSGVPLTVSALPLGQAATSSKTLPVSKPKQKRRLIPTARSIEIAIGDVNSNGNYPKDQSKETSQSFNGDKKSEYGFVNLFPDGFELYRGEEWLLPDPHPGSCLYQDSDHEDEGYWSQILNMANSAEGETAEEQEDRRMKLLARFHDHRPSSQSTQADKASPPERRQEDLLLKQARECMLKEQEAGAERSRKLREKALQRRGLLQLPGSRSDSDEHGKTFSDGHAEDSSADDLFSDKDGDVQMEDLLDIAQEHATEDSKPVQPKVQDTAQTPRHETNLPGPNPLSRVAAEQFRTQSRHFSGNKHTPRAPDSRPQPLTSGAISDSYLLSQGPDLEDREQRLCAARTQSALGSGFAGIRASGPALNDDSAGGDAVFGRPLPSLASNLPRLDRERQEKTARAGYGTRSLVDRISKSRNISEDYDDEEGKVVTKGLSQETKGTVRSRPLSGFELLAAKTRAQDDRKNNDNQCLPEDTGVTYRSNNRPVSTFQMPAAKKGLLEDNTLHPERPTFAPASSRTLATKDLTLPKNFDQLAETEKEVVLQHETAKEKKRDLDAIGSVFWEFAQLLCFANRELTDRTMQTETDELYDIGKYIALVIDQNKSGKARRKRIQDIRDNIKRRIEKAARHDPEPTETAIIKEMRRIFRPEHVDFVHNELPKVQKVIEYWGDLRRAGKDTRKSSRKRDIREATSTKKQVRFADEEEPDVVYSFPSESLKPSRAPKAMKRSGTATENRRQAQHDHQARLEEKLRAQLKLFKTVDTQDIVNIQSQVAETQAEIERTLQDRQGDSESEEEDGAEFVFGAGLDVSRARLEQDINEINSLEDARQKEPGARVSQGQEQTHQAPGQLKSRQLFDPELLRQMQLNRAKKLAQSADPSIIEDKATAVALDSDSDGETTSSSGGDDDEDDDPRICKYIVWGAFRGFADYEDADHYRITATYDKDRAEKRVREHIVSLQGQLPAGTVFDAGNWSCNTVYRDGVLEQHLMLGTDVDHEARVWIEKELVPLGEKRFRQAKRRHAVVERFTYKVYWEKTVTPVLAEVAEQAAEEEEEEKEKETRLEPEFEGYEDLFGPSPSPDPSAEEARARPSTRDAVVTEISRDEIEARTFSCAVYANRDAKDVFLAWYFAFLPGVANEGYRRQEDESMEQTLEALGDWGLFDRSESLQRDQVGPPTGVMERVEEKFRVWVKKIAVKGPGN
ncbi:hypothetical protein G647_08428 [Cladophialophora carrionii CBS 160.54]|uniref:Uncharacterized protein n=1 Tax=Cladophialophora carrionii CBS 160.54 TaxID=1279043 RepID=V9D2A0_9EURO|nr:uncharacterized protein G647_08428 [Cladophialophora carrionii CBS 160.54]ETI20393.1 hypothetical protein G647_08428 [Cladophialophora carrionii CBS 160.54]